jgi:hypothetical protein
MPIPATKPLPARTLLQPDVQSLICWPPLGQIAVALASLVAALRMILTRYREFIAYAPNVQLEQ